LANLATLLAVELLSLLVFGIFYNVHWWIHAGLLAAAFVLATWGIAVLGAVFGALTVNLRLRELMLPVIVYPLLIPLLIAVIELTKGLFPSVEAGADLSIWWRVLVVFDIVFTALALLLADTILVN
jgi:heme exporter protein B